jgi:hypothetical protein
MSLDTMIKGERVSLWRAVLYSFAGTGITAFGRDEDEALKLVKEGYHHMSALPHVWTGEDFDTFEKASEHFGLLVVQMESGIWLPGDE